MTRSPHASLKSLHRCGPKLLLATAWIYMYVSVTYLWVVHIRIIRPGLCGTSKSAGSLRAHTQGFVRLASEVIRKSAMLHKLELAMTAMILGDSHLGGHPVPVNGRIETARALNKTGRHWMPTSLSSLSQLFYRDNHYH